MKIVRSLTLTILIGVASSAGAITVQADDVTTVGSVGIRIAQIPAAVAGNPLAGSYIISRLQPGVPFTQRLEVFNTSIEKLKVDVYPGLATFVQGEFLVGNGREGNELTRWTVLSPNSLVVKPGETKAFNMTITPPLGAASLQQFGVIWAEVQGAPNESGITSVSRVGIRMYVPVGNAPDISIAKTAQASATNEIIIKKSVLTRYEIEFFIGLILLSVIMSLLFLFFLRRGNSDHKFRKENEKRLEAQWKQERDRRRKVWKNKRDARQSNNSQRYFDHYEDEHH